jgi:hypothetical protein
MMVVHMVLMVVVTALMVMHTISESERHKGDTKRYPSR